MKLLTLHINFQNHFSFLKHFSVPSYIEPLHLPEQLRSEVVESSSPEHGPFVEHTLLPQIGFVRADLVSGHDRHFVSSGTPLDFSRHSH